MFCDCDFVWKIPSHELEKYCDPTKAVVCVQHDYKPKETTKMRARKPEDLANNENLTNNSGLGGLTDAPPSAETREHVYEPIQRKNQTESIAV